MQNRTNANQIAEERREHLVKNRIANTLKRAGNALVNRNGDQMTGWLIVVLVVVVVGAVFLTLYQGSISDIWDSIVAKITGLLS